MKSLKMLAVDFGASSGRVMLGLLEGEKLDLTEIHRFQNEPVMIHGSFYWDVLRLFHEIKKGILKAVNEGHSDISSIAIDTWGVDFGLLDSNGELLGNPYHYRDKRTDDIPKKLYEIIPREELYKMTGIQIMNLNTIFQLFAMKTSDKDPFERVDKMLLMPDLFNYFLTGEKKSEMTIAGTSQLLNPKTGKWSEELLDRLGIPKRIFTKIVPSGTIIGRMTEALSEELGIDRIQVVAAAGHDTQAAIAAVPAADEDFVYISSGTWSLMGTEESGVIINDESYRLEYTNEIGAGGKFCFLKNIMGLWLIQESRRQWIREGSDISFAELEDMARNAEPYRSFINPDDPIFSQPGDMPGRVREFCRRTNQTIPNGKGEIIRCIAESLALKYRHTLKGIEELTGRSFRKINIVGGGIKDRLLCEMTASATNRVVAAGPIEATAIGNLLIQAMALGHISGIEEARKAVRHSFDTEQYIPADQDKWDRAYEKYERIINS